MPAIGTKGSKILKVGTKIVTANRYNGGYYFNGSDDQVLKSMNNYLQLQASRPWCIAISFFLPAAIVGLKELICAVQTTVGTGQTRGYRIFFSDNNIRAQYGNDVVSNRIEKTWNNCYRVGWNHLVLEKLATNTAANLKLYMNGIEVTDSIVTFDNITSAIDYTSVPNLILSANPIDAGRVPLWFVADVKIFRRSLGLSIVQKMKASDNAWIPESSRIIVPSGNLTSTLGSTAVTGSGTTFTNHTVGEALFTSGGSFIGNILTINSNTSITLQANGAVSQAAAAYKVGSLVLDWKLDSQGGSSAVDASGLGHTGTVSGSSNRTQGNPANAWRNAITPFNPW